MKNYSDSEILEAIKKAPAPIREIIEDVQTALDIAEIGQRLNFHIDQIGTLAELNRNMLLGLIGPQEFFQELIILKIPEIQAKEIMNEINQKIFVPLQKQMREEASASPVTPPPPSRIVRTMAPAVQGANASMPSYAPPKLEVRPSPVIPPTSPMATQGTARSFEPRYALPPPPPMIIPTASLSVQNLASSLHDVIREVTAKAMTIPSQPAPLPPKTAMPGSVPTLRLGHPTNLLVEKRPTAPVPEALPGAMGNAGWPPPPTPVSTTPPAPLVPRPIAPPPPAMPYSDDPYREPIDEK